MQINITFWGSESGPAFLCSLYLLCLAYPCLHLVSSLKPIFPVQSETANTNIFFIKKHTQKAESYSTYITDSARGVCVRPLLKLKVFILL